MRGKKRGLPTILLCALLIAGLVIGCGIQTDPAGTPAVTQGAAEEVEQLPDVIADDNTAITIEAEEKTPTIQETADGEAAFVVSDGTGGAGERVAVTISLKNNPGIIAAALNVSYDREKLELVGAEDAGLLADPTFADSFSQYPYYVSWNDALVESNTIDDGPLVTLTFKVLEDASGTADISVDYAPGNVFDWDLNDVFFKTIPGTVTIE